MCTTPRWSLKASMEKIPEGFNDFIKQVLFRSLALLNGNFTTVVISREKDGVLFLYGSTR